MGRILLFLIALSITANASAQSPTAKGVYRFPYADGTEVVIWQDHLTHSPTRNRLDMAGIQANATIVAAAAGVVRIAVDDNSTICLPPPGALIAAYDTSGNGRLSANEIDAGINLSPADANTIQTAANNVCAGYSGPSANCCMRGIEMAGVRTCAWAGANSSGTCGAGADGNGPNNYVWIEHPNGEWSKYTHFQTNSLLVGVNDNVVAGAPLGIEGDVGIATSAHLHFEIARIESIDAINAQGWLIDTDGIADADIQNRNAVFCQLGVVRRGDTVTATPCDDACGSENETVTGTITASNSPNMVQASNSVTVTATVASSGGLATRAGNRITLAPGFSTNPGGTFSAEIGACDAPGGTGDG